MSSKLYKYQLWGSKPKETPPSLDNYKYFGWELITQTDNLNTLFAEKIKADEYWQETRTTIDIDLKVVVE